MKQKICLFFPAVENPKFSFVVEGKADSIYTYRIIRKRCVRLGDYMGGPHVSHVRLDKANQRIIVSEIFVYSPDKMKRNLVRQMEASLYTLKLPGSKQEGNEMPLAITKKDSIKTEK